MSGLLIASQASLSGKTAVACGLARIFASRGIAVRLHRAGDDGHAADDRQTFEALSSGAAVDITEAPAGPLGEAASWHPDARMIAVATPGTDVNSFMSELASVERVAGVILNHVPDSRASFLRATFEKAGARVLGVVSEDFFLASPPIGLAAETLQADARNLEGNRDRPLGLPAIASIAADPGQTYFSRLGADSIIVRSDKPDLQLAALNAGATCMIVTGDRPLLSYVIDRVDSGEIPLLRTALDTRQAVSALEGLFGTGPFRGEEKARRIEERLAGVNVDELVALAPSG